MKHRGKAKDSAIHIIIIYINTFWNTSNEHAAYTRSGDERKSFYDTNENNDDDSHSHIHTSHTMQPRATSVHITNEF